MATSKSKPETSGARPTTTNTNPGRRLPLESAAPASTGKNPVARRSGGTGGTGKPAAKQPVCGRATDLTRRRPVQRLAANDLSSAVPRAHKIAEAAYFRAQSRNFAPGGELQDWLAAEQEVDDQAAPD